MTDEPLLYRRQPKFDFLDLELFARVVEAGSITHGAARVHLALPSASARIRLMEAAIGTALLVRGRRGVAPTPAGYMLLRHARTVLHQMDQMTGDLAAYSDGVVATVRVLANTAAVASTLPADLMSFLLAHPNIDIDLEERPSHAIVQAVAGGRAEIGIIADSVDLGRLHCTPLRRDHLVLLVAPGHQLAERSRISFHETLGEPFVGLSEGSALQEHLEGKAHPLGEKPLYRVRLPNAESVCQAVSSGVGISVLPEAVVQHWQPRYPVATVLLQDNWANRQLVLCTQPSMQLSGPALALSNHFVATMSS